MFLRGYIDESERGDHFTLTSLISEGGQWNSLESDWREVIAAKNRELLAAGRKQLSRYHATYCNGLWDEFEGWSREEEIEFTRALIEVISRYQFNQHSYSLNLKELTSVIPEIRPNPKGFAYVILFTFILLDIAEKTLSHNTGSLISIFHDTCDFNAALRESYDEMTLESDSPLKEHRHRFVSMAPMTWRHCIALQPADLLAFENGKEFDRQVTEARKNHKRRKSLNAIMNSGNVGGTASRFNDVTLQEIKKVFDSMSEYIRELILLRTRIKKRHNQPKRPKK